MDEGRPEDDADTDQEQNNGNNEQNLRPDLDAQQLINRHIHSPSLFELLWEQNRETEGNILSRNHWFPPGYAVHWLLLSKNRHEKNAL